MPAIAIRKGDRVKVEFEGTVTNVETDEIAVRHDNDNTINYLPPRVVALTARPVKVGDVITPGLDAEPPIDTVIIYAGGSALKRESDGWYWATGSMGVKPYAWNVLAHMPATIAWLPQS